MHQVRLRRPAIRLLAAEVPKISGGVKFRAVLTKMAAKLSKPGTVRVGFLEGSTSSDGQSMPLRAALNEFGHEYNGVVTPPRPFMRNAIAAKSGSWASGIAFQLKATDYDVNKTLSLTGMAIEGDIKQSIIDFTTPPLSPVTIAKKGFDKPLVETGDMLNAVASEVKT